MPLDGKNKKGILKYGTKLGGPGDDKSIGRQTSYDNFS